MFLSSVISTKGFIITDSNDAKNFIKRDIDFSIPVDITMHPYGGFIINTLSK